MKYLGVILDTYQIELEITPREKED